MNRWARKLSLIPLLGIVCSLYLFPAMAGAEDLKIGYINSVRIREDFKEFADAQGKFDNEMGEFQKKDQAKRAELDSLMRAFESQSLLLSEAKRKEKQADIEAKKEAYRKFYEETFGPGGALEKKNEDLTKPLLDKINAVLEKIAVQGNYAYIFDAVNANLAYAKPQYDLTDQVLQELGK